MKIIVTYASCGAGHFKAAQALYDCLCKRLLTDEVSLVDILDYSTWPFRAGYTSGYAWLVRSVRWIWSLGFWFTEARLTKYLTRAIASSLDHLNTRAFARFLIKEDPDVIVCTHFVPAQIATDLKQEAKIHSRLITVVTDFGAHRFWISQCTDLYVVACEFAHAQLIEEGIREDRIKELGIPVHEKFTEKFNRKALCRQFGINDEACTVLLMTGSFGIGPLEEIVEILHEEVQVLVVCAANRKLHKRLERKRYPKVRVFDYVENIQDLMAVSDILVTKPGGLSISEALTMEVVPVLIDPIPGQEVYNSHELKRQGVGFQPAHISEIRDIVLTLKNNPAQMEHAKAKLRHYRKPNATRNICDAICKDNSRPAC